MRNPCFSVARLRRTLVAVVLASCVLAYFSSPALADGDPASDVLLSQDLFVAADAHMPVAEDVEFGHLLASAAGRGFPIRVAIIAQPDDLGAITGLWGKPASYASFLGIELSLTYTGRLLVVMPAGFGFYWHGHPATAGYRVLATQHVGAGGDGLATSAQEAVRALALSSGVRLKGTGPPSAPSRDRSAAARSPSWNVPGIVLVIVLLDLAVGATAVLLALRAFASRRRRGRLVLDSLDG